MICSPAALLVLAATFPALAGETPVITQQPSDRALCAGSQTSLSISAGGIGPITYEWQFEAAPRVWIPVHLSVREEGVWARVSVGVDEQAGTSTLFYAWIGTNDTGRYRCIVSGPFGNTVSEPARLTALTADFGSSGGQPAPDWRFDNNDFIAYIDAFFAGDRTADLASAGAQPGGDGVLDNNDFIAFIDLFFSGCIELH